MNIALRLGGGMAARDGQPGARSAVTHGGDDVISEHDSGRTVSRDESQVDDAFGDYFRCHRTARVFPAPAEIGGPAGYFTFFGSVCYGATAARVPAPSVTDTLPELSHSLAFEDERVRLPFDFAEVVGNLRLERYAQSTRGLVGTLAGSRAVRELYYLARPLLGVSVRRHLQKLRLADWRRIAFPRWPVDFTVDELMRSAMSVALRSRGVDSIPFVWFWPDGANACAIVTHDVESVTGQRYCSALMDMDDAFGIKSSFQVMPEPRDAHFFALVDLIRRRGFELNLHDLNHDGHLFRDRNEFLWRAAKINEYARQLGCRGFRSGAMYREQDWFGAFEFSYDMSVPNAAHLEPQRGGCCTVMPYFVGNILELPLTTTQDYSLFHILGDYSTALWKQQIASIASRHGLISFIAHPDYLVGRRERAVYEALLSHLSQVRDEQRLWVARPGEVDDWWRKRHRMSLVPNGGAWRVVGEGSERARVAYASLDGNALVYRVDGLQA